jgi:hypothetical protein
MFVDAQLFEERQEAVHDQLAVIVDHLEPVLVPGPAQNGLLFRDRFGPTSRSAASASASFAAAVASHGSHFGHGLGAVRRLLRRTVVRVVVVVVAPGGPPRRRTNLRQSDAHGDGGCRGWRRGVVGPR